MTPDLTDAPELAAAPKFKRGSRVSYLDHHDRYQNGEVRAVEASWRWSKTPHIKYEVTHPSYRNKRIYLSEDKLRSMP